jgi:hypothetical protein
VILTPELNLENDLAGNVEAVSANSVSSNIEPPVTQVTYKEEPELQVEHLQQNIFKLTDLVRTL